MKIAYLMNTYPMTSTTFIRREIEALEERGVRIKRYAVRGWSEGLVDPRDIEERKRTEYLLSGNVIGLLFAFLKEILVNPAGLLRGLGVWYRLNRAAKSALVQHVAYLLQAVFLRQRSQADGIDHIHVHFSTNATAVAMLARAMGGAGYSFTAHGPDEFDAPQLSSVELKIRNAAFVVAISHFCKSQLIRYSGSEYWNKIKVIRCGIDLAEFDAAVDVDAQNQTFVCVGRLCPNKGQFLLVDAVKAISREFPSMKLVLIGDGVSRPLLERRIRENGLERWIELRGWVANAEVRDLVAKSRALILPSFAEGLPVVFMEALALRRPVIATYIAGIPELVDSGCGWIVPAGDENALVVAMRSALENGPDALQRLGAEGRRRVERQHDVRLLAESLDNAFNDAFRASVKAADVEYPERSQARV
jgi:glycosyltransferase involved in cell wall biosynthesis